MPFVVASSPGGLDSVPTDGMPGGKEQEELKTACTLLAWKLARRLLLLLRPVGHVGNLGGK